MYMARIHTHTHTYRADMVYSSPAVTLPKVLRHLKAKVILSKRPRVFPENSTQEGFVQ